MTSFDASISIHAPEEAVWRLLSDVAAWPAWLPTVTHVEPLDSVALVPGARFAVRQPRLRPAVWVVTQVGPGHFEWVSRSPGLRMVAQHTVLAQASGGSRLELRFSFAGLLGGLAGRLFGPLTRRYVAAEAAALKRASEAAP